MKKTYDQFTEMINRELDGALPPAERARLEELLSKDPLAHELREDLRATAAMLASAREVEPPPTLRPSVMRAIEESASPKKRAKEPVLARLAGKVRDMVTLKNAYPFSAGLAVGALLLLIFVQRLDEPAVDPSGASGTIVMPIERAEVSLQQIHGFIQTRHSGHSLWVDLNLSAEANVLTRIEYDPKAVRVGSVKLPESHSTDLRLLNETVEIQGAGDMRYTVAFLSRGQIAPPVRVSIFSAGELIYEKSIALEK